MNDVLTHELVHAYDDCRARVNWDNLEHLACSEVSASAMLCLCNAFLRAACLQLMLRVI